jgi:hypothetical protein
MSYIAEHERISSNVIPIVFPMHPFEADTLFNSLIFGQVRGLGIEPRTNWLKANCSTAELPARFI